MHTPVTNVTATGDAATRLLSIAQTAERLGMGAQTVRDLWRRGDLPFPVIRLGRKLKVKSADLDRWLES